MLSLLAMLAFPSVNPLAQFVSEQCNEESGKFVKLREFFNEYNAFLAEKRLRKIPSVTKLGKLLRAEGYEISPRRYKSKSGEEDSAKSIIGLCWRSMSRISSSGSSLGSGLPKLPILDIPQKNNNNILRSYIEQHAPKLPKLPIPSIPQQSKPDSIAVCHLCERIVKNFEILPNGFPCCKRCLH